MLKDLATKSVNRFNTGEDPEATGNAGAGRGEAVGPPGTGSSVNSYPTYNYTPPQQIELKKIREGVRIKGKNRTTGNYKNVIANQYNNGSFEFNSRNNINPNTPVIIPYLI